MVDASLNARKRKLEEAIETDTAKVEAKRGKWNTSIINDMEEELQQKKSAVRNITAMLSSEGDKKSQQKFSQMKNRRAVKLFEAKRIKRRAKTTQGNTCLIDSDDEDFIAKCIEDKATYQGRRHDLIMYTNKRVKKRDLLNIANYRLLQKKKKLVKSATTVYNRSKPRSSRSIQAKRHRGKGLFCSKKPPKAEDADNENTHFQRAHVKNVKFSFFGKQSEQTSH
ncbi:RNA-directed DNA polymerase from transposon X-element [Paramuricea clavata]|uniref:RNA-directed DNA polymerase from transposon X-element n=1 Tax=Paramuricea clavata TaxID=317549 RepID=A0A6S7JDR4_PARCT|nr:RNA-directed DNA polymerase from transposon X-element [Paramuricea clavata]